MEEQEQQEQEQEQQEQEQEQQEQEQEQEQHTLFFRRDCRVYWTRFYMRRNSGSLHYSTYLNGFHIDNFWKDTSYI